MWFNSMQREEPLPTLDIQRTSRDGLVPSGTLRQVLHGCRQLVSWNVGLSPATSATLILVATDLVGNSKETTGDKPEEVGMTSSHHGPYDQGYTRDTMAYTEGSEARAGANLTKYV